MGIAIRASRLQLCPSSGDGPRVYGFFNGTQWTTKRFFYVQRPISRQEDIVISSTGPTIVRRGRFSSNVFSHLYRLWRPTLASVGVTNLPTIWGCQTQPIFPVSTRSVLPSGHVRPPTRTSPSVQHVNRGNLQYLGLYSQLRFPQGFP